MKDKEKIEICENCKIKDNCSHRILTHMEKCKVNDCDYFQNISTDKEIIEEMAKEIMKPQDCKGYEDNRGCYFSNGKGCDKCKTERHENAQIMADHLYNAGYRKLPKNSVVLSKEEYDKLYQKGYDDGKEFAEKFYKPLVKAETSKETAEKFVNLPDSDILVVDTKEYGEIEVVSVERLQELARLLGVEIKE